MGNVPLPTSSLVGLCLGSFFYGLFVLLFAVSTYFIVKRHITNHVVANSPKPVRPSVLFWSSLMMAVAITAHWVIMVYRAFQAFIKYEGGTMPSTYYSNLGEWSMVASIACVVITFAIGDVVLLHRLWVIWNHQILVMIFPVIFYLANCACYVGLVYQFTQYARGQDVYGDNLGSWIISDWALSMSTHISCTGLIVWRLRSVSSTLEAYGLQSGLSRALSMIVDSAALELAFSALYFGFYEAGSNIQWVILDMMPSAIGVTFMLINVRVGLGYAVTRSNVLPALTYSSPRRPFSFAEGTVERNSGECSSKAGNSAMELAEIESQKSRGNSQLVEMV